MTAVKPFTDEQLRTLINLRQRYEVWMDAERALARMPYDLRIKTVSGKSYLYEIFDRSGNGKSLGRLDDALEEKFHAYRQEKQQMQAQRDGARGVLEESARLYRALRLPMLSSGAGPILQECDRRGLLGSHLLVVGTNAIAAYALEAAGFLVGAPEETEDFDLAWSAIESEGPDTLLWDMLKSVDPTFTVNTERSFQARNAKAYEVEILVAPSRADTLGREIVPNLCRCRSRNGCCLADLSIRLLPAGMERQFVSSHRIPAGSRSRNSGCRKRKAETRSNARKTGGRGSHCLMPLMKPCLSSPSMNRSRPSCQTSSSRTIANGDRGKTG